MHILNRKVTERANLCKHLIGTLALDFILKNDELGHNLKFYFKFTDNSNTKYLTSPCCKITSKHCDEFCLSFIWIHADKTQTDKAYMRPSARTAIAVIITHGYCKAKPMVSSLPLLLHEPVKRHDLTSWPDLIPAAMAVQ